MKKNNNTAIPPLGTIRSLVSTSNPRAEQADITNAPYLFGDPESLNNHSLAAFEVLSGDPDGDPYGDAEGDPFGDAYGDIMHGKVANWVRNHRGGVALAAGMGAGYLGGKLIQNRIKAHKAHQARVNAALQQHKVKQTLSLQREARAHMGKIDRNAHMPFFQLSGARMNSSPIDATESFIADMFKHNLDRQASDTPYLQETAIGVYGAGNWVCTAVGDTNNRFYTALILQVGINYLNAAPGTIFTVTAVLPTINGTLTISSTPWIFTIAKNFDVRFLFFPWQLVQNRPMPVLGQYSNSANIVVTVAGLPSASAVSLIVPGSMHPWTIAMRNSLI